MHDDEHNAATRLGKKSLRGQSRPLSGRVGRWRGPGFA